jgi:hypothetical protein
MMGNLRKALSVGMDATGDILIDKYQKDAAHQRSMAATSATQDRYDAREDKRRKWQEEDTASKRAYQEGVTADKRAHDKDVLEEKRTYTEGRETTKDLKESKTELSKQRSAYLGKAVGGMDRYAREQGFGSDRKKAGESVLQLLTEGVGSLLGEGTVDEKMHNALVDIAEDGKVSAAESNLIANHLSRVFESKGVPAEESNNIIAAFYESLGVEAEYENKWNKFKAEQDYKDRQIRGRQKTKGGKSSKEKSVWKDVKDVEMALMKDGLVGSQDGTDNKGNPMVIPKMTPEQREIARQIYKDNSGDLKSYFTSPLKLKPLGEPSLKEVKKGQLSQQQGKPQAIVKQLRTSDAKTQKGILRELLKSDPEMFNKVEALYSKGQ